MAKIAEVAMSPQQIKEYHRFTLKRALVYRALNTELNLIAKHWVKVLTNPEVKERWEEQFEVLYEAYLEIYPETRHLERKWKMDLEERAKLFS